MKSKSVEAKVYVEWFTVKAKRGILSTPHSDMYYVNIVGKFDGEGVVHLREFTFLEKQAAKNHFEHLKNILGISKK